MDVNTVLTRHIGMRAFPQLLAVVVLSFLFNGAARAQESEAEPLTAEAAADQDLDALSFLLDDSTETAPDEDAASADVAMTEPAADSDAQSAPATVETIPLGPSDDDRLPEENVTPPEAPKHNAKLEEIVVTARKREESIQEIPVAVTAFNAGELEQRGFTGLEDIASATPGFTFEAFSSGGAHGNPVIRGLAQQFTTSRIQNVSFFLDGVYLQRQSMLNLGMIDMERVEVVKGPQNALYGRNAFAGAVNYVTQLPTHDAGGYLMATTGDNEREEYRISVGGPLNHSGTVLGKFTYGTSNYEGHTKNNHPMADANPEGPNQRGNLGGYNDETVSVSLVWEPTDTLRFRTSYYGSKMLHEASPSYSISGVNAARFGFRFADQNDLNCNYTEVDDIGIPWVTHEGYSAYCGELPQYASDVSERRVDGMVIDPRAIGTIANTKVATFLADYEFTDSFSMHYLFGYADHDSYTDGGASDEDPVAGRGIITNAIVTLVDNQNEAGYTFANTASGRPNTTLETTSHELRFDWDDGGALRTSFGGYYSRVKDEEWTSLYIMDLCNADSEENMANCNRPIYAENHLAEATVYTAAPGYDQYVRQHGGKKRGEWTAFDESIYAAFASVTFAFTDRLDATVEARYSVEKKIIDRYTDSSMLAYQESVTYSPLEYPVLPFANTLESAIVVPHDEATFRDFTPRGIVNWQFADDHMLYASVAHGVKSGGFNNADSPDELIYDEETNWTYEIGSKNQFFNNAVTFNLAVYYVDWDGLQGGVPPAVAGLSTSDVIKNIGGATSFGVEVESVIHLFEGVSVDIGLSYNDARYKDGVKYSGGEQVNGSFHCDGVTCPADGDVSGNQLPRTSKEQYSVGLNYVTYLYDFMLRARVDGNYQSKQYVTPLNLAWVPERFLTNASLQFATIDHQWELSLWGKNLTDEDYASNSFYIGVFNQYMVGKGAARTFGASLKYSF